MKTLTKQLFEKIIEDTQELQIATKPKKDGRMPECLKPFAEKTPEELVAIVKSTNEDAPLSVSYKGEANKVYFLMSALNSILEPFGLREEQTYSSSGHIVFYIGKTQFVSTQDFGKATGEKATLSTNAQECCQVLLLEAVSQRKAPSSTTLFEFLTENKKRFGEKVREELFPNDRLSLSSTWQRAFLYLLSGNYSDLFKTPKTAIHPGLVSRDPETKEIVKVLFDKFGNIGIRYKDKVNPSDIYLIDPTVPLKEWSALFAGVSQRVNLFDFMNTKVTFDGKQYNIAGKTTPPVIELYKKLNEANAFNSMNTSKQIQPSHLYCEIMNDLTYRGIIVPISLKQLVSEPIISFKDSKVVRELKTHKIAETTSMIFKDILREEEFLAIKKHKDDLYKRSFDNWKIKIPTKSFAGGSGDIVAYLYLYENDGDMEPIANFQFKRNNGFGTNMAIESKLKKIKGGRAGKATSVFTELIKDKDTEDVFFQRTKAAMSDGGSNPPPSVQDLLQLQQGIRDFLDDSFIKSKLVNPEVIEKYEEKFEITQMMKEGARQQFRMWQKHLAQNPPMDSLGFLIGDGLYNFYCLMHILLQCNKFHALTAEDFVDILTLVMSSAAIIPLVDLSQISDDIAAGYVDGLFPMISYYAIY